MCECGLEVTRLDKCGKVILDFAGQSKPMELHIFRTLCYSGTLMETEGIKCKE